MNGIKVENITPAVYTDDFVTDCARISYSKRSDQFTPDANAKLRRYLAAPPGGMPHWAPFGGPRFCFWVTMKSSEWVDFFSLANLAGFSWVEHPLDGKRTRRIEMNGSLWAWHQAIRNCWLPKTVRESVWAWLAESMPDCVKILNPDHGRKKSDFAIPVKPRYFSTIYLNLRIKAPIFMARQLGKHQVHLLWNEVSRRYVKDRPELIFPAEWNEAPEHSKQGASSERILEGTFAEGFITQMRMDAHSAVGGYESLIDMGLAPEQARAFLPQAMATEWIWTGSLDAFHRVLHERMAPTAQKETKAVALLIADVMKAAGYLDKDEVG